MSKFLDNLCNLLVPVWSILWIVSITALSFGVSFWAVKWVLTLLEVL